MFKEGDQVRIITREPVFAGKIGTITQVKDVPEKDKTITMYLVRGEGLRGAMQVESQCPTCSAVKKGLIENSRYYQEEQIELYTGDE